MLKRGGTHLSTIPKHTIWIECLCGHVGPVRVAELLAVPNPPVTVADAVGRSRCRRCGARIVKEYRLVYEGGSASAMASAGPVTKPFRND